MLKIKIAVVQINVTDMDLALNFYCGKLGFEARSREAYPDVVVLDHPDITLLLYRVSLPAQIDYPNVAQTLINFEVTNITNVIEELGSKGVNMVHNEPQVCPVGLYAAFRDPFGNIHEIIEFQQG